LVLIKKLINYNRNTSGMTFCFNLDIIPTVKTVLMITCIHISIINE